MAETKKINATVDLVKSGVEFKLNGGTILSDDGTSHYLHSQNNLYLYSGSSNTMVLTNSGNVGIGTASPGHKLDVRDGNIKTDKALISQGPNSNWTGAATFMDWQAGSVFGRVGAYDYDASTWRPLNINDGSIYITGSNGNVGIGTTSPGSKLEVSGGSGAINGSGLAYLNNSDDAFSLVLDNAGTSSQNDRGVFEARVGGSSVFRINNSGNVGIGTTSPVSKLHVFVEDNGDGILIESSTVGTNRAPALKLYPKSSSANERYWAISPYKDTPQGLSFASSNAKGDDPYSSGTTRMLIDGITGNVGIGTASPSEKLDVIGDVSITVPNANTSLSLKRDVSGTVYTYGSFNNAGSDFNINGTGNVFINADSNSDSTSTDRNVTFGNRGVEYMRINNAGNVGIGTTSPGEKLVVQGNDISALIYDSTDMSNDDESAILKLRHVASTESASTFFSSGHPHAGINFEREWGSAGSTLSTLAKIHTYGETGWGGGLVFMTKPDDGVSSSDPVNVLDLTPDGEALFSGNVGIGTTSPATKLHIKEGVSNILIGSDDTYGANYSAIGFGGLSNGHNRIFAGYDGSAVYDDMYYAAGTGKGHQFRTNGSGDTKVIINSAGNVGIGTTSPGAKLEVEDSGADLIDLTRTSVGTYRLAISGNDRFSVYDVGEASERLSIASSGNVGIGTTSPEGKLHVKASDTTAIIKIEGGNSVVTANGEINSRLEFGSNDGSVNSGGNVGGSIASVTENPNGAITGLAFSTFYQSRTPNDLAEAMRITGSGNVGIGTTSPSSKLSVNGTAHVVDSFTVYTTDPASGGTSNGYIQIQGEGNQSGNIRNTYWRIQNTIDSQWGNGALVFYKNYDGAGFSEQMRIASSGNVGIGTSSPISELHVVGSARVVTNDSAGGDTLIGAINGVSNGYRILTNTSNEITYSWNTGDNVQAVTINNSGNVGIGTTSPSYKLDVNGITRATTFLSTNATGSTGLQITSATASGNGAVIRLSKDAADKQVYQTFESDQLYLGIPASNTTLGELGTKSGVHLRFATAYSERMRITSDGNVGIGTTSPAATLHISKGSNNSPTVLRIENVDTTIETDQEVNTIQFYTNDDSASGTGITSKIVQVAENPGNQYGLSFYTYDVGLAEALRITNDGNVGIGTTSPSSKLEVSGTGRVFSATSTNDQVVASFTCPATSANISTIGFEAAGSTSDYHVRIGANATHFVAYTNNVERMRILANGNVGIGTTSPQSKLHVQGGAGIFNVSDDWHQSSSGTHLFRGGGFNSSISEESTAVKIFNGSGVTGKAVGNYWGGIAFMHLDPEYSTWGSSYPGEHFWIGGRLIDTPGQERSALVFATNNGTTAGTHSSEKMVILPNGNVGIGTTSPQKKLDVYLGTNDAVASIGGTISSGEYAGLHFGYSETSNSLYRHSAIVFERDDSSFGDARGKIHILNSPSGSASADLGDSRLTILPSGNVGIGTTTPSYKFTVSSGTDDIGILTASSDSGSYVGFLDNNTSTIPKVGAVGNKLILDASQYVGVRRTDPSYALDVSGTIRATGDVIAYSDARVKENVETIPNALDKVKAMRGVGYNKIGEEKRSVGVIAQELLEVLPEAVHQDEAGMYSVAYGNIVGVLIEAMKEQQKQIDELKAQLDGITK